MTVLVTGGKGFIGARVIKNLVERGEDVVCFEPKSTPGRLGDLTNKITMVEGDIVNYEDTAETISRCKVDRIAHMVFFRADKADELYKQQMIMHTGTFHIFEAARLAGVKRLVFPSSIQYHGHDVPWTGPLPVTEDSPALPTTGYGIGKHLCEHLACEYNTLFKTQIVIVRIPGAFGPGARLGARGVNLIGTEGALGKPVVFPYAAEQHVVVAHVDDIAEIVSRALFAPELPHQVYHVGGHYVSYGDIAELGRKLLPDLHVSFTDSAPLKCSYSIDSSRMTRELGVHHRSLEQGYLDLINDTRTKSGLSPIAQTHRTNH
ncbi:MAG: NAD(P)-dependent oxidoreductase [Betaproteobacteria bacterium]|nr:NAD(P)-dependent oxidoreductase [Betaproteobacteria bacterium]